MSALPGHVKNNIAYLKQPRKKSAGKRLFSLFVLLAVLYFSVLFVGQYFKLLRYRQSLAEINAEIEAARATNAEMRAEIERLHSPAYLEQIAREELGMVRDGELLFYFREEDSP
ncbi:MAG: septum formation initiator family protein [Firmicutes bacterium]|nr:septum formation initiator family protein [Bacillota bacterium]